MSEDNQKNKAAEDAKNLKVGKIGCLVIVVILGIGMFMAQGNKDTTAPPPQQTQAETQTGAPATAPPSFEILDQQKMGTIKMTMAMVIPQPVDKETLTAMAKQLYADYNGKKYEKVFMEWYLPGMKRGAGAWAVTNFMPGLNVNILR